MRWLWMWMLRREVEKCTCPDKVAGWMLGALWETELTRSRGQCIKQKDLQINKTSRYP